MAVEGKAGVKQVVVCLAAGEEKEEEKMAEVDWWAALVVEGCTALSLPRRVDCALAVMRRRLDTPPQRSLRCSPHVGGRRAVLRGLLARR